MKQNNYQKKQNNCSKQLGFILDVDTSYKLVSYEYTSRRVGKDGRGEIREKKGIIETKEEKSMKKSEKREKYIQKSKLNLKNI